MLYRRVIFGELVKPALQTITDLTAREIAILAPLVVVTLVMGVYPKPIFDVTSASVAHLIDSTASALAIDTPPKLAAWPWRRAMNTSDRSSSLCCRN